MAWLGAVVSEVLGSSSGSPGYEPEEQQSLIGELVGSTGSERHGG